MRVSTVTFTQPEWLGSWLAGRAQPGDDGERLAEVLALTAETVARGSGGPFAAIVYDERDGSRLGAAVNTVVANATALAHAETSALALAQQRLGHFSLDFAEGPQALLVTSSSPCTMCLGAIAWSGVRRVLFCTTREDVEAIGFDEGPVTGRWRQQLAVRGIQVQGPRCQQAGRRILQQYLQAGGAVYNGHADSQSSIE